VRSANDNLTVDGEAVSSGTEVDVVIEVPRGGFVKRGSTGQADFISPLPCPFNDGSVPAYIGLEGDLLDALLLGRRPSGDGPSQRCAPNSFSLGRRAWQCV
jgi:inorganic pyrophosphatase